VFPPLLFGSSFGEAFRSFSFTFVKEIVLSPPESGISLFFSPPLLFFFLSRLKGLDPSPPDISKMALLF